MDNGSQDKDQDQDQDQDRDQEGPSAWHRRHALQLAVQLPDNQKDALLVVAALKQLVESYLLDDVDLPPRLPAVVLAFVPPSGSDAMASATR